MFSGTDVKRGKTLRKGNKNQGCRDADVNENEKKKWIDRMCNEEFLNIIKERRRLRDTTLKRKRLRKGYINR